MERLNRFELKSLNTPITATVDNADPNTVRPLHILKDSFNHVLSTFKKNNNYDYVLEQLKSIRQDLTIQGIRNDFTVKVYEENARLAIMNKDRGEFNQCQTCLKQLYKEGIPGNESEFTVYTILYLTYMKNHLEMVGLVSSLPLSLKSKNFIHSAIKLYTAHINSNYIKFFRIYKRLLELPLAKYLIDMFIDTIRVSALKAMISSYNFIKIRFMPKIPQSYVISVLSFDGVNHLHTWMKEKEIDFEGDKDLDCKALRQIVFNV